MSAAIGATLEKSRDHRGPAPAATSAEIRDHCPVINGGKARNGGGGGNLALGRQRLEEIADAVLDPVAGGLTGQLKVADIAPIALRGRAVTSNDPPERTAVRDVLGIGYVVGATQTDNAFVTVLNGEGAIAQALGANCGGQEKQGSDQQSCRADQMSDESHGKSWSLVSRTNARKGKSVGSEERNRVDRRSQIR